MNKHEHFSASWPPGRIVPLKPTEESITLARRQLPPGGTLGGWALSPEFWAAFLGPPRAFAGSRKVGGILDNKYFRPISSRQYAITA